MKKDSISDEYNLERFVHAQRESYPAALAEIRAGKKKSHWMWYIFPQIAGLGNSEYAKLYAINNRNEAEAYLQHPVLSTRLKEICLALLGLETSDPLSIFGSPDNMKLKSSMTLFVSVPSPHYDVFKGVLDKFFDGRMDTKTLEILKNDLSAG